MAVTVVTALPFSAIETDALGAPPLLVMTGAALTALMVMFTVPVLDWPPASVTV